MLNDGIPFTCYEDALECAIVYCSRCKQWRPPEQFGRDSSNKYGISWKCKTCTQLYKQQNRERIRANSQSHYENNKELINEKKRLAYQQNKDSVNSYRRERYRQNSESISEYRKRKRDENKDSVNEYHRNYYYNDREKLIEYHVLRKQSVRTTGVIPIGWRDNQYRNQEGLCYYCKNKMESITIDHIISVKNGGTNSLDNLVLSCVSCNSRKKDKHPDNFAREIGRLLL